MPTNDRYHYQEKDLGEEKGPLPIEELRDMLDRGEIPTGTMIRRDAENQGWEPLTEQGKTDSSKVARIVITLAVAAFVVLWQVGRHMAALHREDNDVAAEVAAVDGFLHSSAWKEGYQSGETYGRTHAEASSSLEMSAASMESLRQGRSGIEANDYALGFKAGCEAGRHEAR